jgi:hypothetical protein
MLGRKSPMLQTQTHAIGGIDKLSRSLESTSSSACAPTNGRYPEVQLAAAMTAHGRFVPALETALLG